MAETIDSICFVCELPVGEQEATRIAAALRGDEGATVVSAHADCFVGATNNPRLAALGVAADESATDKLTPRAKRLWAGAATVAREFGHDFIGTEHLLLAVVREPGGIAGRVLDELVGRHRLDERLSTLLRSDEYNAPLREADE